MNKRELGIFAGLAVVFLLAYFLNFTDPKIKDAVMEAFYMLQWYARNHTLACVVPAMFIAGAIACFFSKEAVLRHLGPKANRVEAYSVASVSGTVLAVCSCSVLPMFAGIYRVGAGLGPASAFLYSGPAINVMAIFLTARVLGYDLGIARLIGSIVFAVIIGLIMAAIFRKDEDKRTAAVMALPEPPPAKRSLWQTSLFFLAMIAFLVFSDWANPSQTIIHKKDGTRMQVAVMLETTEMYRVQIEEPVGDSGKGRRTSFTKSTSNAPSVWRRPITSGPFGCTIIGCGSPEPASWRPWRWWGRGSSGTNWPSGWARPGVSPSPSFSCSSAATW